MHNMSDSFRGRGHRSASPEEVFVADGTDVSPSGAPAVSHIWIALCCAVRVRNDMARLLSAAVGFVIWSATP